LRSAAAAAAGSAAEGESLLSHARAAGASAEERLEDLVGVHLVAAEATVAALQVLQIVAVVVPRPLLSV